MASLRYQAVLGYERRETDDASEPLKTFSPTQLFEFMKTLHAVFEFSATRMDLCFDDFKKIMFPHQVVQEAEKGNFTGFKRWEPKQARRVSGEYLSDGIGFGLRGKNGSGRYLRCYDKTLESQGEIDAIRWEVELTKETAKTAFLALVIAEELALFTASIAALIGGSINFIDRKGTHLDRMSRLDWWQDIVNLLGCVKLRNETAVQTIESSIQWVAKSVASTLLKVEKALGKRPFDRWMDRLRENAPLNKEQEAQVRVYRIQQSLPDGRHLKTNESVIGGLVGLSTYFLGLNWELIFIWIIIMILDVISGIIKGVKIGWNSHKFKMGLLMKGYEGLVVIALLMLDRALGLMGFGIALGSVIIGAFVLIDMMSIIENGIILGVKFPKVITDYINKANNIINDTEVKKDE